jgi:hypothetical protein
MEFIMYIFFQILAVMVFIYWIAILLADNKTYKHIIDNKSHILENQQTLINLQEQEVNLLYKLLHKKSLECIPSVGLKETSI